MTRAEYRPPKRLAGKSPEELLALARATGATDRMQLWRADQALAKELVRRDLMEIFAPMDRRDARTVLLEGMTDRELLEEACRMIETNGWSEMKALKAADWKLADRLRERNLTSELARIYGWRTRRRTGQAAQQEDPRLLGNADLAARALALQPTGFDDLHRKDSVLYHTLRRNAEARDIFSKALGLRRAPVKWKALSDADWFALARSFGSAAQMKDEYQAAWTNAGKLGKQERIAAAMHEEGSWTKGFYDQRGNRCESVAELLVFNQLVRAGTSFDSHPLLPFGRTARAARADAFLPDQQLYLEIWMCSEEGLADRRDEVPEWFSGYVDKRREKLAMYEAAGLSVLSLEAEIARRAGTKAFLEHVVEILGPVCGVTWQDPQELRISGSCPALQWDIDGFLGYARDEGLVKLSDFQSHPHREMYNVLMSRDMRDNLRIALDREHGRPSFVRR